MTARGKIYCSKTCAHRMRNLDGRKSTEAQYTTISGNWHRYLSRLAGFNNRNKDGLTKEHLLKILKKQDYKCALSGVELTCLLENGKKFWTNASVDRINPGKPYTVRNVQLVCAALNNWRSNLEVSEFVRWCRLVAEYQTAKEAKMSKRDPVSHRTPEQIKKMDRGYNSTGEMKKKRAMNNAARRQMEKEGRVHKGDGKDVDHKKPLRHGGSNDRSNLRVVSKSTNRAWAKKD